MPPAATRNLARQLLEVTQAGAANQHESAVAHVTEQLRAALTRFAGADSFNSLLRRTLALARAELPALATLTVGADGRLHGLGGAVPGAQAPAEGVAIGEAVVVVSHLLWLLSSFIGMPLTIRLIEDAWPSISLDLYQSGVEEDA